MVEQVNRQVLVSAISELVSLLSEQEKQQVLRTAIDDSQIPVGIFFSSLSTLEALVLYLKEQKGKTIKEISVQLQRSKSTIYTTYAHATVKRGKEGTGGVIDTSVTIPLEIFSTRKFSILESLVAYLHESKQLRLTQVAQKIGKHYSTVKTTYFRYSQKKRGR